jgi:hypothetical protein
MKGFKFDNRRTTITLLIGLLLLILLVFAGYEGSIPRRPEFKRHTARTSDVVPIESMESTVSTSRLTQIQIPDGLLNPFHTEFYRPAPAVAPPKTLTIEIAYRGSYESAEGDGLAFIGIAGTSKTLGPGAQVIEGWFIGNIGLQSLVLTNTTGMSNVVKFRGTTKIEIPK